MNSQREVIYTRRRHALYGERIEIDLNNIMYDFATTSWRITKASNSTISVSK